MARVDTVDRSSSRTLTPLQDLHNKIDELAWNDPKDISALATLVDLMLTRQSPSGAPRHYLTWRLHGMKIR